MTRIDLSLYLVLDPDLCATHGMVETARAAVAGGATAVQLRHKSASTGEMITIGRALQSALSSTNTPLIINDDVDAAIALSADGLHVGQGDMPAPKARERIGRQMILAVSVENQDAARRVDADVVDHVGVGPIFATSTKPDHKPPIGIDGLAQLVAIAPVPAVAIGGLKAEHVRPVLGAGAVGMAVVSAICGNADPKAAAQKISAAVQEERRRLSGL